MATGPLGERVAERRDQAHQPFEPDLGKPHRWRAAPLEWKTSVGKRPTDGHHEEPLSCAHGLLSGRDARHLLYVTASIVGMDAPVAAAPPPSTTLATSKIASHTDQVASSLPMIVRFTAPHYQLLCPVCPGAEPRKGHHAKVVLVPLAGSFSACLARYQVRDDFSERLLNSRNHFQRRVLAAHRSIQPQTSITKMLLANPKMLGNKMNKTGIIIGVKI